MWIFLTVSSPKLLGVVAMMFQYSVQPVTPASHVGTGSCPLLIQLSACGMGKQWRMTQALWLLHALETQKKLLALCSCFQISLPLVIEGIPGVNQ